MKSMLNPDAMKQAMGMFGGGGMPGMPPGMGMGMARPGVPKPTKPAIRPVKKLQPFNWRRVLVLPPGAPGKKDNIWDTVTEIPLN